MFIGNKMPLSSKHNYKKKKKFWHKHKLCCWYCKQLKKAITNSVKVFRGEVSEQIGNYEYLHILPQHSGAKILEWQWFAITLLML